jgi:hypothetical protein
MPDQRRGSNCPVACPLDLGVTRTLLVVRDLLNGSALRRFLVSPEHILTNIRPTACAA